VALEIFQTWQEVGSMKIQQCDLGLKENVELHDNYDVTKLTTAKLKDFRSVIEIKNKSELSKIIKFLNEHKVEYVVLGAGSNFISRDNKYILWLNWVADTSSLTQLQPEYILDANIPLGRLTSFAIKMNLRGWEIFTGVPANLGGAVFMNAGTRLGEISQLITQVEVIDVDGNYKVYKEHDLDFSYRKNHFIKPGEIITSVGIKHAGVDEQVSREIKSYIDFRRKTQPSNYKNCGCVFKNPSAILPAGKAIDLLALKGAQLGDVQISQVHANFFENLGHANTAQYLAVIELVRDLCERNYHLVFEMEVKCL
jgi:UDP-N-acetylmuramate dehydrogenase